MMIDPQTGKPRFWASLTIGIIVGIIGTLFTQGIIDRLKVENRIAFLETSAVTSKDQLSAIQAKVDYLYDAQLRAEGEANGKEKAKAILGRVPK